MSCRILVVNCATFDQASCRCAWRQKKKSTLGIRSLVSALLIHLSIYNSGRCQEYIPKDDKLKPMHSMGIYTQSLQNRIIAHKLPIPWEHFLRIAQCTAGTELHTQVAVHPSEMWTTAQLPSALPAMLWCRESPHSETRLELGQKPPGKKSRLLNTCSRLFLIAGVII